MVKKMDLRHILELEPNKKSQWIGCLCLEQTKMEKTRWETVEGENQWFYFGHIKFEMLFRYAL